MRVLAGMTWGGNTALFAKNKLFSRVALLMDPSLECWDTTVRKWAEAAGRKSRKQTQMRGKKCGEQAVTSSSPNLANGKYPASTRIDFLEQLNSYQKEPFSPRRLCLIGDQGSGFVICKNNLLQSAGTIIIEWQMHFKAF